MSVEGTAEDKRTRLVLAGRELLHEQGFQRTTLADVAGRAGVPLGNVYYYFKTKDSLCEAIIEAHLAALAAQLPVGRGGGPEAAAPRLPPGPAHHARRRPGVRLPAR